MAISKKSNAGQSSEQEEKTSRNFILRIWRTDKGTHKGYILDPLTNETYPLTNIPQEAIAEGAKQIETQGVLLEALGCWIGLWNDSS